jgi:site-specific recombinase XerD
MDNHMALANNALATRTNYIRGVRHLMMQLGKLPEDCTAHEVKAFLVKLREEAVLSSSSLNLRVCGLKYYFRHVAKRLDLVVAIPNPRIAKYDTEVLDSQELLQLFAACRDVRQLLVIQLFFDTGMRSGELLRLQLKDFDKKNRTIILRKTKGQVLRVIPYGEHVRIVLKDYIQMLGYYPKGALLESYKEKGKALSIRGLQHIVREIARRSGIKKRISCHTLRHSYAVHFLNNGGNLPQLQRLLGHQNITTTLHYLKYAHLPLHQVKTPLDILMRKDDETKA